MSCKDRGEPEVHLVFAPAAHQTARMSRILIPTRGPEDWRALLASPETQWQRGFSAMSAALSWEASRGLPSELDALLGGAELLLAIPEHKVALPGGSRESQCDVFALVRLASGTCGVAVEAKVNEPFGPTIADWLSEASPGKQKRLSFICDLLGLEEPDSTLRYQLLHRTAAAILEARRFGMAEAAMVVQSFAPDHRWFGDFASFGAAFGHDVAPGIAVRHRLPDGMPLSLGWTACALP